MNRIVQGWHLVVLLLGFGAVVGTDPLNAQENDKAPVKPSVKASSGFSGEMIYLRDFGTDEVGFLSVPMQEPQLGVIIVPDGRGLDNRVKKICDALAARGYLALAVDLYNGRVAEDEATALANRKSVDADVARKGLETGLNFYAKSPRFLMSRTVILALGDSEEFALNLSRTTKNRSLLALSLVGGSGSADVRDIRQRVQQLEAGALADPVSLAEQLHAFWSAPETRKNFFERLVE